MREVTTHWTHVVSSSAEDGGKFEHLHLSLPAAVHVLRTKSSCFRALADTYRTKKTGGVILRKKDGRTHAKPVVKVIPERSADENKMLENRILRSIPINELRDIILRFSSGVALACALVLPGHMLCVLQSLRVLQSRLGLRSRLIYPAQHRLLSNDAELLLKNYHSIATHSSVVTGQE